MRSFFINGDRNITKHFVKEADHKLPEDPKKWAQAVTNQLYASHPWLEPRSIKVTFEPKDEDSGSAIGAIVIDKKYTVPLIIKDFRLKDLDVYFAGKKKKPLNKASFNEELQGTKIGTPRTPSDAEISDMSTWQQTRMPMAGGRMSLASYVDGDEALSDLEYAFTEQEYSYAAKANPIFARAVSKLIAPTITKAASADAEYEWKIVRRRDVEAVTMENGPVCMVDAAFQKIACLIGNKIIDPVTAEPGTGYWGIEANHDSPRFFIENTPNISTHPIKTADLDNYSILEKEAADMGWHAYVVPDKDNFSLIGPFMSGGVLPNGHELVSTGSGQIKVAHMPGYGKPYDKFKDLFIVGNGAVKVALGAPFHPLTSSEVNFMKVAKHTLGSDFITVSGSEDYLHGFKYSSDNYPSQNWKGFSKSLEKEARVGNSLRKSIEREISVNGKAIIKKVPSKQVGEKTASTPSKPYPRKLKDIKKTAMLLRAASLIRPMSFTTISVDENQNLVKSARDISHGRAEETVDSILSLGFIDNMNSDKFTSNIDKLDEAKEACVELLLASRLGLSVDPAPYKTAMAALDDATRDLKQYRQVDAAGPL